MIAFESIFVPLVTPFHNGLVDYDSAQRLAAGIAESGVSGLVVCGTTGEAATVSENEQARMVAAVLEAVGPRCPVILGISGSDTRAVAQRACCCDQSGISGYLVSAPPYVRPSQEGILKHFQAIAATTERPIILYNIPARTGVNIDLDTVISLSDNPRFTAIKECGSDMHRLTAFINHTALKVLAGDDALIFAALGLGGHGAISAAAHIRPDLYARIFSLMRAGHQPGTRALSFSAAVDPAFVLRTQSRPAKGCLGLARKNSGRVAPAPDAGLQCLQGQAGSDAGKGDGAVSGCIALAKARSFRHAIPIIHIEWMPSWIPRYLVSTSFGK